MFDNFRSAWADLAMNFSKYDPQFLTIVFKRELSTDLYSDKGEFCREQGNSLFHDSWWRHCLVIIPVWRISASPPAAICCPHRLIPTPFSGTWTKEWGETDIRAVVDRYILVGQCIPILARNSLLIPAKIFRVLWWTNTWNFNTPLSVEILDVFNTHSLSHSLAHSHLVLTTSNFLSTSKFILSFTKSLLHSRSRSLFCRLYDLKHHTRCVSGCSASRDGGQVATAGWDGVVRLWRVKDGQMSADHIKDT